MSYLGSADLQNCAEQNVASQSDQPDGQIAFPPFSGKLSIDENLKLRNENFNETIYNFFKDKSITPLSQLTTTPPFPTPHALAQFASKAYTDYKTGETDAQYETRLDLPDGWKLLMTASNSSKTNGYFGAAYWHPEYQQVVIAHRGTDPTNFGALWTDVAGVLFKYRVPQMCSASTFAYNVVEVLRLVNQGKGVKFQVFFTGHSLGGWLAQITNFTTKYLDRKGNTFLKSSNVSRWFHSHTVSFDSPGCKDMLSEMADELDVLYDGRSIDIEHLDITSYLSAPNRINTCNKHVGTVYRIFTDLSDMGWQEKSTALYNLATHSMDKIVEAFDPETGQVYTDEQGKLKIQVVVDWPVTAGLSRGKQYKSFFKWAKHFNNYHPEIRDITFQLKDYTPIRYQTKTYDERVISLSKFSYDERQFLENYRQICQLPELFKPKELFSAMEDNEAQEAEKILQSLEIKNRTIRCKDAAALQSLIPYVKTLLQLFPEIKENTKCALSPHEIRNNVYQIGTKRYLEMFQQSPFEFTPNALALGDFLNSDQEKVLQLRMVDGDAWTGLSKVYQVLEKTDCLSEGHYTILTLEHLLYVNRMVNLNTLMESTTAPHLLMMTCDTRYLFNDEAKQILRQLFNTLKKNQSVKIILTTQSEDDAVKFLQDLTKETLGNGFVTRDEELTWCDLTTITQEKLLEKPVKFQGARIFLNELMSAASTTAKFLPLGALLEEKELQIADPVPISNGYNEGYYIGRTLRYQKTIKQDIFNDKGVIDSHVYLASTEEEYTKLCQLHPTSNVHWVEKDKSGKLLWQQSQGNLKTILRYIDTESPHTYIADDLDKLLEQAQHQRVMLISDTAGMGKSTVLTHLSKQIKQKFPAKWVVRIDLNSHTDALKELEQEQIDKEKVIEFISEKVLKLEAGLEVELFKQCCEQKQKARIVIMLDGFDEISPFYKQSVIDLLQALRQTAVEQLWVTARPHLREELEDKLQQLSYTLEPFSEKDQGAFLRKFWSLKDWFTEMYNKEKEESKQKLKIYAKQLIQKLSISISDKDTELTGIPLQTRMLAEAFDKEVKTFCQSSEYMPELQVNLELLDLYRRFIERKYDIYQEEKLQIRASNVAGISQRERDLKIMREDHQLLALKALLTGKEATLLQNIRECSFSTEDLIRIGIVQVSHDGKLHFIHRTFAEYFVADCLVNRLTEGNNFSEQLRTFILKDIFLELNYEVIRVFIDGLLSRSNPTDKVLKQCGNWINDFGDYPKLILHKAAREGNANIFEFLLDSAQAAGYTEAINKMLLGNDKNRDTVWKLAAERGNIEVIKKIWEWAQGKLTTREIKNKLLLGIDDEGRTAWHLAAFGGKLEVMKKIWEWAKERLTTDEIKNDMLLRTDRKGRNAWHLAAFGGKLDVLQKIWEWAKERLTTEEIKNEMLLRKDIKGRNAWYIAAYGSKVDVMKKIWEWTKERLTTQEIKNEMLLRTDIKGRNAWHVAAYGGKLDVMQKIWAWAKERLTTDEIKNEILLRKDIKGRNAWYIAAYGGKVDVMQKIREWAKERLTREEIKNEMFLRTDVKGRNAWYIAAYGGKLDVIQRILEWAKERLTTEEIKDEMLLRTDIKGRNAWYIATYGGKLDVMQKIWEWAKERLTAEEIKNEMLLRTDIEGRNAWHIAAYGGKLDVMQKICEWAKERLTTEEIKNEMLLRTDDEEKNAWHLAAFGGELDVVQKIWECAKERLTTEEIKNELLLRTDIKGRTAWHEAAYWGKLNVMQKIWELAQEKLTAEEIKNEMLLRKDIKGRTAWEDAEYRGKLDVRQKIREWAQEKLTKEEMTENCCYAQSMNE